MYFTFHRRILQYFKPKPTWCVNFLTLEQASFETSRQNRFRRTSRRMQVRQHCTLKREDNTRIWNL